MDHRVLITRDHLTSDLRLPLQLGDLARSLNLSASRLRHLFTIKIGLSPLQYLKEQRMLRAKDLLENTHYNIKEIMRRVGVRDQSHFVRDFKKAYNLTPVKYRAQHLHVKTHKHLVLIAGLVNK